MLDKYKVEPCEFTCARKFLDALDETDSKYRGETWIYRGQGVDKELMPSAMRPCKLIDAYVDAELEKRVHEAKSDPDLSESIRQTFEVRFKPLREDERHSQLIDYTLENSDHQYSRSEVEEGLNRFFHDRFRTHYVKSVLHSLAERILVVAFAGLADRAGLKVPQDNFSTAWNRPIPYADQIKQAFERDSLPKENVIDEYESIAYALARHHNVPTRLLDFTFRPLVAAFFAADHDEKNEKRTDGTIIVWAIHQQSLPDDLQVVKHRRSEIGYLRAQDGLFLYDTAANDKYWLLGEWAPFDYYFHSLAQKEQAFKFTLPYSERSRLLDLLELKGISRPMIMPSYDYVGREIQRTRFDVWKYVATQV